MKPSIRTRIRSIRGLATLGATAALALGALAGCGGSDTSSGAPAADGGGNGYPYTPTSSWTKPALFTDEGGTATTKDYKPIDQVTKPWKICALFPHLKDSYWLGANYGIVEEAKRDHVQLDMFEAGGYTNLATQVNQMDDCVAQGYDGIVLGAISSKGVASKVAQAKAKGIPVIDFINGVESDQIAQHTLVSFELTARDTAKHIIKNSGGKPVKVGLFPGPEGAGFADDATRGFMEEIKGTNVEVVVTRRADTGKNIQLGLIQDALQAYPDMNYIVGVDIAAEAAVVALRNAKKTGKVGVAAYVSIVPVFDAIKSGEATAGATDFTVMQGRMAIDQMVRILQKQQEPGSFKVGPIPEMISKDNIDTLPYEEMFAPPSFKATFSVKP